MAFSKHQQYELLRCTGGISHSWTNENKCRVCGVDSISIYYARYELTKELNNKKDSKK